MTEAAIGRIEATNPDLNYLVTDCFEQALATEPHDGPFTGVPMLVKDLNETAGVREVSHGLRQAPFSADSVTHVDPNSGVFDFPSTTKPAFFMRRTTEASVVGT